MLNKLSLIIVSSILAVALLFGSMVLQTKQAHAATIMMNVPAPNWNIPWATVKVKTIQTSVGTVTITTRTTAFYNTSTVKPLVGIRPDGFTNPVTGGSCPSGQINQSNTYSHNGNDGSYSATLYTSFSFDGFCDTVTLNSPRCAGLSSGGGLSNEGFTVSQESCVSGTDTSEGLPDPDKYATDDVLVNQTLNNNVIGQFTISMTTEGYTYATGPNGAIDERQSCQGC